MRSNVHPTPAIILVVTLAVMLAAVIAATDARAAAVQPDFAAATFVPGAAINNPYFPLTPGTSTAGSWRAGENGAQPGFIMPADRIIGFNYFQENAPADGAVDQATIVGFRDSVTVPAGTFTDVLDTLESNPLEPGAEEHKL